MARVLIVGCGCRGRALGATLREHGHAVRGTSRREEGRAAIAAAGLEPVAADPARLATLTPHLQGVSVLCWLLAAERFATLLETLVDTHVRGVVYESPAADAIAAHARAAYRMPVERVTAPVGDHERWLDGAVRAVGAVLE